MLYFGDMRETNADKHTNCATILAFGLFDQMSPQETSKLSEETSVTVCNCGHFLGEFRFLEFTIDTDILEGFGRQFNNNGSHNCTWPVLLLVLLLLLVCFLSSLALFKKLETTANMFA